MIQNTTWGGIQGFSRVPSTPWSDDKGNFAGIVHQERGLTYAVVYGAGHQLPLFTPELASVPCRVHTIFSISYVAP
jgi:carboxypeptidase D